MKHALPIKQITAEIIPSIHNSSAYPLFRATICGYGSYATQLEAELYIVKPAFSLPTLKHPLKHC
jgi:hypothetical protein